MTEDRIWRDGATPAELVMIAAWDARLDEIARERHEIAAARTKVCNRACQRERYRRKNNITGGGKSC